MAIWDDALLWYARAVRAMQARPTTDPRAAIVEIGALHRA